MSEDLKTFQFTRAEALALQVAIDRYALEGRISIYPIRSAQAQLRDQRLFVTRRAGKRRAVVYPMPDDMVIP